MAACFRLRFGLVNGALAGWLLLLNGRHPFWIGGSPTAVGSRVSMAHPPLRSRHFRWTLMRAGCWTSSRGPLCVAAIMASRIWASCHSLHLHKLPTYLPTKQRVRGRGMSASIAVLMAAWCRSAGAVMR